MELLIYFLWVVLNSLIGRFIDYPLFKTQTITQDEKYLVIRKAIIPIGKFLISIIISVFFTNYEYNNEIFINAFGVYFMGSIFHKGLFYQSRRNDKKDIYRKNFHYFSHSVNHLIKVDQTPILDIYALGRICLLLLGYAILFVEFY